MAHTVYLGSFSKKLNSTAQPAYTGWTSYSCVFKDETSLYQPTLTLSASWASMASSNFNYAVMLGKYYWIRDIRAIRTNLVEVSLQIDPLATYKSNITSSRAFIEYGQNTFNAGDANSLVPDQRLSIVQKPTFYVQSVDPSGGIISPTAGCYIVQAVGYDPNGAHRGLATFALTASEMHSLMDKVNDTLKNSIDDIMDNPNQLTPQQLANELLSLSLKDELLNESCMAAIQSVLWLPLNISGAIGTPDTPLYLGNYYTEIDATMLTANAIYKPATTPTITIPWPVNDWKRHNCQILLYVPFFGTIPIPIDQCITSQSLTLHWTAEYFSGSISLRVASAGNYTVFTGSTNIGTSMGIGRSAVGTSALYGGAVQMLGGGLEMAGGIVDIGSGTIGAFLGQGGMGEAAMHVASGAQNVMSGYAQTIQPVISCAGTMGGMAAIGQEQVARLVLLYFDAIDESDFTSRYGHPVFSVSTPANGFCKTRGFSVSGPMPGSIAGIINAAMDGGVFIE